MLHKPPILAPTISRFGLVHGAKHSKDYWEVSQGEQNDTVHHSPANIRGLRYVRQVSYRDGSI